MLYSNHSQGRKVADQIRKIQPEKIENYTDLLATGFVPALAEQLAVQNAAMTHNVSKLGRHKLNLISKKGLIINQDRLKSDIVNKLIQNTEELGELGAWRFSNTKSSEHDLFRVIWNPPLTTDFNAAVFATYAERVKHIPEYIRVKFRTEFGEKLRDYHSVLSPDEFKHISDQLLTTPTFSELEASLAETLDPIYLADLLFTYRDDTMRARSGLWTKYKHNLQ